ncbi:c-type cytochrome [Roseibium sp.]|uniref:c-type cytochrome n=1 Tax=Roseibium sp. TaxID=1936156 RepID=UPI003D0ECE30
MTVPAAAKIALQLAVFSGCAGAGQAAFAEGDPANGRTLAKSSQCSRCHGQDGNVRSTSFQPVPMLAG